MSTSVSTTSGRESGSATDEYCHKVGAHPCCADRIIQFGRAPTDSAEKWGRWQIPMSGRRLSGSTRPGRRPGVSCAYWGQNRLGFKEILANKWLRRIVF